MAGKVSRSLDRQEGEVETFCEGYRPLRDANKLLKKYGLAIRYRGHPDMGDAVYIRIEELKEKNDGKSG